MGWYVWRLGSFYRIPVLVRQHGHFWRVPNCRVLPRTPSIELGIVVGFVTF